jgi:hypothetical protein
MRRLSKDVDGGGRAATDRREIRIRMTLDVGRGLPFDLE